jgi:hypothetical protein
MDTNQQATHRPKMILVKSLVIEFLREHLYDRGQDPAWLFDRLENDDIDDSNLSVELKQLRSSVVNSLLAVAIELEQFVDNKYNDRFTELTEPLVPKLRNGSKQKYYDAFKSVADELFSHGISWSHIVTFLVYSVELTNKVLELPSKNDQDKTFKMVSQIVDCICRYFDESVTQWIDEQDGGWLSVLEYERASRSNASDKDVSTDGRGVKQYIGVAAVAAIIGGLYLCSKLAVQ